MHSTRTRDNGGATAAPSAPQEQSFELLKQVVDARTELYKLVKLNSFSPIEFRRDLGDHAVREAENALSAKVLNNLLYSGNIFEQFTGKGKNAQAECQSAISLIDGETHRKLWAGLLHLVSGYVSSFTKQAQILENVIDIYERDLAAFRKTEVARVINGKRFGPEDLDRAAKPVKETRPHLLPESFDPRVPVVRAMFDLPPLAHARSEKLYWLRNFVDTVSNLESKGGKAAAQLYIDCFLTECATKPAQDHVNIESPATASGIQNRVARLIVQPNYNEVITRLGHFEKALGDICHSGAFDLIRSIPVGNMSPVAAVTSFALPIQALAEVPTGVIHAQEIIESVEPQKKFEVLYSLAKNPSATELFGNLKILGVSAAEFAAAILEDNARIAKGQASYFEKIAEFAAEDDNLAFAQPFVAAVNGAKKMDLLHAIADLPSGLDLYGTVRRDCVTPLEFANFLIAENDLRDRGSSGHLDKLEAMAAVSWKRPGVSYLIQHGAELLDGPYAETVINLVDTKVGSEHVLKIHQGALHHHQSNHALMALYIGIACPTVSDTNLALKRLRTIPSEDLQWVNDETDPSAAFKRFQAIILPRKPEVLIEKATGPRIAPIDQLLTSLEDRGMSAVEIKIIRQAHDMLPRQLRSCFQIFWREQPDDLLNLSRDAIAFGNQAFYQKILEDKELFALYRIRLVDEGFDLAKIKTEVEAAPGRNVYAPLRKLLAEPKDEAPPPQAFQVDWGKLFRELGLNPGNYSTVYIFGGQYRGEKRAKIENAAPSGTTVQLCDYYARESFEYTLTPNDLVIFNPTAGSRTGYIHAKARATEAKAAQIMLPYSGYKIVVEALHFIGQESESKL